jgi:hypothetical protein
MSLLSQFLHRSPNGPPPRGAVGQSPDQVPTARGVVLATTRPEDQVVDVRAARRIALTLLATVGVDEDDLAMLEAEVDERVDVWTPSIRLRSRFELVSALVDADDTIGEIAVAFSEAAVNSSTVLLEWSAIGRFTGPALLDDDELIEPTGAAVRVDGALGLSFSGGHRATEIRCYYDRLALIEQLVPTPPHRRGPGDGSVALLGGRHVRFPGTTTGHGPPACDDRCSFRDAASGG